MAGLAGVGMLRVVSNTELSKQEEDRVKAELEARQNQPVILGMASHLRKCWDAALDSKRPIEQMMLKAKRQRNGEYEPDKIAAIAKQGGSDVYMRLTEVKCRAAESWVRDILLDEGAPPWDLQPTPIPDLNPDQVAICEQAFAQRLIDAIHQGVQVTDQYSIKELKEMFKQDYRFKLLQEAQEKADRMSDKIKDQFAEGGWYESFNNFVTDLVTYPAAFIKGPVVRRELGLEWGKDEQGNTAPVVEERLAPQYERVDPFRMYPEPGISNLNEGYLFQHHPMPRSELAELIGVPGYDEEAIRALLDEGQGSNWFITGVETEKQQLENKFRVFNSSTTNYDAIEFWGKISGKMLVEWGLDENDVPDQAKEYDANVWLIGDKIIKAVLNYDPLGEKPYACTSFYKVAGALWGMGIPPVIEDIQSVCNAAARSLVNNMGIASGPQVEVNVNRLAPNEDITQIYPWKIWQVLDDPTGSSQPAIRFEQPDDRAATLMKVYETFSRLADEHSGIPAYVSGDISVTGAGRTSSGLSMLMGAAGKGIRQVVSHIDNDVIKMVVKRQFVYNMRYDEDESIKGDVVIIPRGAVNLAVKETTNVRRIEFLNATANPIDAQILGVDGRAALLREVAKGLSMEDDQIVPSRERLAYQQKMQAGQPQQEPGKPSPAQQPFGSTSGPPAPQVLDPSGAPTGGAAGNLVSALQPGR